MIRELRALNENPETLLRAVVINMLPQDVRVALSSMAATATLEEIGEQAYTIMDLRKDRKAVSQVSRQRAPTQDAEEDHEHEVDAISGRGGRGSRGNRGRGGNRHPAGEREEPFICFSHKRFGSKAFTCKTGCTFAGFPLAQRGAGNDPAGR